MTEARQKREQLISSEPLELSRKARRLAEIAETPAAPAATAVEFENIDTHELPDLSPADVAARLGRQVAAARATHPVDRVPGYAGSEAGRHPRRATRRMATQAAAAEAQRLALAVPAMDATASREIAPIGQVPVVAAVSAAEAPRVGEAPKTIDAPKAVIVAAIETSEAISVQSDEPISVGSLLTEAVGPDAVTTDSATDRVADVSPAVAGAKRRRREPKAFAQVRETLGLRTGGHRVRWVPRLAMLGAMSTVTIALPLIGIVPSQADGANALEARDYLTTSELTSGVQLLGQEQSYQQVPFLLAADPDGEARMRLEALGDRASRSEERTGLAGCDGVRRDGGENGKLPDSWLCTLWNPSIQVRADAALALGQVNELFRNKFGSDMCLSSGYRTFGQQSSLKQQKPFLAAPAGKSNHGEGLAVDFCGQLNVGGTVQWKWLKEVGPKYGWDNPAWAQRGGSKYEPWHWEFVGGGAK